VVRNLRKMVEKEVRREHYLTKDLQSGEGNLSNGGQKEGGRRTKGEKKKRRKKTTKGRKT